MTEYKTFIPSFDINKGEYMKETTTPDTLAGYTSCGIWFDTELKLFAIGGNKEDNFCTNWDIYADTKGTLYSIARTGSSCKNSFFGDCNHIKNLIRQGYFGDTLTDYGMQLMNA